MSGREIAGAGALVGATLVVAAPAWGVELPFALEPWDNAARIALPWWLRNLAVFGDNVKLHGHNYVLEATVSGAVDPLSGMAVDISVLR